MPNRTAVIELVFSITLTLLSAFYQRIGPIQGFTGTECGNAQNKCYEPVLNGGFPFPFIVDYPTISIPDYLNTDDDFLAWAFLIDIAFYWILIFIIRRLISAMRKGNR